MHILNIVLEKKVILMTVIKFYTFYKKQYEPSLCLTKNLVYMIGILLEYLTFPSSGAKLIEISDLAAASTGIGKRTHTRRRIITTLIVKKTTQDIFNL